MNITIEKTKLRGEYAQKRMSISEKEKNNSDKAIFENLKNLPEVKNAKMILTYVSVNSEADTRKAIDYFLEENKKVAVAKCLEKCGEMDFYFINSLSDLRPGKFNIPEPCTDGTNSEKFIYSDENKNKIICLVPGLVFTKEGFRLGYGGGYYDRFLALYPNIISIGLCNDNLILEDLPKNKYDMSVNIVVTDKRVIRK